MENEIEIIKAIAEHLGLSPEDLDRKALLREDLNLGPIELNDLLDHLSKKFEINLPPDEAENLSKVEDIIILVEDNLIG
ncbi:acyl carrier protein [Candidatus Daviesbacteria bacterium]|nr:acyl carrier protein [Candidatus Daviesbacteria bacterium]